MISVIQRVTSATVSIDKVTVGRIHQGIVALVAVEKGDDETRVNRLADRLLNYRIFCDREDRMNRSVKDISGGILMVPQFTLAADTRKGTRPSFTPAAEPGEGKRLFELLVSSVRQQYAIVECGVFGTNMKVALTNDGPVTFILRSSGSSNHK